MKEIEPFKQGDVAKKNICRFPERRTGLVLAVRESTWNHVSHLPGILFADRQSFQGNHAKIYTAPIRDTLCLSVFLAS